MLWLSFMRFNDCFPFNLFQNNTAKLVKQLSKSSEDEGKILHAFVYFK